MANTSAMTSRATAITRTKGGKIDSALGFERRWVIYNGYAEAFDHSAGLAWLDAPHDRYAADGREVLPRAWAEAASAESDRHAGCVSPERFDAGAGPPSQGHRRLPGVDAGALTLSVRALGLEQGAPAISPAQSSSAVPVRKAAARAA